MTPLDMRLVGCKSWTGSTESQVLPDILDTYLQCRQSLWPKWYCDVYLSLVLHVFVSNLPFCAAAEENVGEVCAVDEANENQ